MDIRTGQTIYEQVVSVDSSKEPVLNVNFDTAIYRNGEIYTGATVNVSLADSERGVYCISWSADTTGVYQLYAKNETTDSVFMSDKIFIKTDYEMSTNVYVGI